MPQRYRTERDEGEDLLSRRARVYNELAPDYDCVRFASMHGEYEFQETRALVLELSKRFRAGQSGHWQALDVACGTGRAAIALAKAGGNVFALDAVDTMLRKCLENARQAGVGERITPVLASADCIPFPDESFEMLFSIRFLHLFPPSFYGQFLREMFRVTKPQGYVAVEFSNASYAFGLRKNRPRSKDATYSISLRQLRSFVEDIGAELVWAPGLVLPKCYRLRHNRALSFTARWLARHPLQSVCRTRVAVFYKTK